MSTEKVTIAEQQLSVFKIKTFRLVSVSEISLSVSEISLLAVQEFELNSGRFTSSSW